MSPDSNRPNTTLNQAAEFWADMRARWARGEPAKVEDYLARPGFPPNNPDLVMDLIYGEFVLREHAGQAPQVGEYIARFPHLEERITRQFELHQGLSSASAGSTDAKQNRTVTYAPTEPAEKAPPPPGNTPTQIGKYRVITKLGEGGQATVYRAVHPRLGQDVVIKLGRHPIAADSPDGQRLASEGRILTELRHPNLARVYDLDQADSYPFVVMEYVPGRSLSQAAHQERPSPREAARTVAAVARAVAHAHSRGVVHLDIKPANILLGDDGVPRLIDFGLGRFRPAWTDQPDDTTEVSGTLSYLAPERATGATGQSLERADVFGLGGVLYFLLTGRPPFRGETAPEIWYKVVMGEWDQELLNQPSVPRSLRQICQRSLAADPANRYGSADALARDLERFARGPMISRRGALAAAVLVPVIATGLTVWLWPDKSETPTVPPAPPGDPKLRLRVWNGERYRDLLYCLPLQTGDALRIEAERPAGFHATLLWVGSDGQVHELLTASPEQKETEMAHPEEGHARRIEGQPGTELILLCGRRDSPVDVGALRSRLAGVQQWPALPRYSLLRMDRDGVTVENSDRGPGGEEKLADPEGEVKKRLQQLHAELRQEYDALVGLAFSHR